MSFSQAVRSSKESSPLQMDGQQTEQSSQKSRVTGVVSRFADGVWYVSTKVANLVASIFYYLLFKPLAVSCSVLKKLAILPVWFVAHRYAKSLDRAALEKIRRTEEAEEQLAYARKKEAEAAEINESETEAKDAKQIKEGTRSAVLLAQRSFDQLFKDAFVDAAPRAQKATGRAEWLARHMGFALPSLATTKSETPSSSTTE